ncbi:MAG: winged helix-turn-helix domain-containing protein [Thermoproteota archaeon]|nr:winged helix-turn-helix domain-containing protein [Thermoproteota archaeon]
MGRRTKYDIYADLLRAVSRRGGCRVTKASYGANLPVDRTKSFLSFLASRGFVRQEIINNSKRYHITKRGLGYLQTFKKMKKMFAALAEELE